MRPSGRAPDQMRELRFEPGFTKHAEGSCLVSFGDTRVLVTASLEEKVPPFLRGKGQGWVTAEYGMLPRATHTRGAREAAKGKQSGRTQEIQRLIGRSLRAAFDLSAFGERTLQLDCDVLQADGGTRTAAITGAFVAAQDAVNRLLAQGKLAGRPEGALFDRLVAVQADLLRGPDGTEKPLSCSTAQIRRIAEARPGDEAGLARHLDQARLDRFGAAFLREIAAA